MNIDEFDDPPAYDALHCLYDDTHRGKQYIDAQVESMGNAANLMGYLPNHLPTTDGSFSICMARGNCTLVSKRLYESIPPEYRDPLNTQAKGNSVRFAFTGDEDPALGSTIMPILLTNAETGQKFCIRIYALVMENLFMGMFIGQQGIDWFESETWGSGGVIRSFDFGNEQVQVVHRLSN